VGSKDLNFLAIKIPGQVDSILEGRGSNPGIDVKKKLFLRRSSLEEIS
jgi:hypothetical protein